MTQQTFESVWVGNHLVVLINDMDPLRPRLGANQPVAIVPTTDGVTINLGIHLTNHFIGEMLPDVIYFPCFQNHLHPVRSGQALLRGPS